MKRSDLDQFSESIIRFYEKLFSREHAVAKDTGLSPQQNHTIDIVGSTGSIRMKSLAKKLSVTTGTLTVMIDRLEKSGFVYREKDPRDGRGFNINLTQKGDAVHKEHHACHIKLAEDILSGLEPDEAANFADILIKINESI
ncbi:MAG: MarR family transcriptional regulator [Desulfobacula sp.]|nr:MarR family transcriptional regulator [Desulfobacula sp.]